MRALSMGDQPLSPLRLPAGPAADPATPQTSGRTPSLVGSPSYSGSYQGGLTPGPGPGRTPFVDSPRFGDGGAAAGAGPGGGALFSPPPAAAAVTPEFTATKRGRRDPLERAPLTGSKRWQRAPGEPQDAGGVSSSQASFEHAWDGDEVKVSVSVDRLPATPPPGGPAGAEGGKEAPGAGAITPFEFPRHVKDRVNALGGELQKVQKVLLHTGIILDVIGKISLIVEMGRFADKENWAWFSFVLLFFAVSGTATAQYWMAHYTWDDEEVQQNSSTIFSWTKRDAKRFVRRTGAVCAVLQLGTAFAALRALRTKEHKKKAATMDLKGMRLVDTVFLSLAMAGLQVYIGMACTAPGATCPGRRGFDGMLVVSILASIISSMICFLALDLKEDWKKDKQHLMEIGAFILYRVFELASRVTCLALFAVVAGGWIFAILCLHLGVVFAALRYYPRQNRQTVWDKLLKTRPVTVRNRTFRVPVCDDAKLLLVCLAWQPSCFVSDATNPEGHFWWRAHFHDQPKRGRFASLEPARALVPFSLFNLIVAAESALVLGISYAILPGWCSGFFNFAYTCMIFWLFFALTWISIQHQWQLEEHAAPGGGGHAKKPSFERVDSILRKSRLFSPARTPLRGIENRMDSLDPVRIPTFEGIALEVSQSLDLATGFSQREELVRQRTPLNPGNPVNTPSRT